MDIVLHLGAHRTGTSTFQKAMKAQSKPLEQNRIAVWTPKVTRNGLFEGLIPNPMNRGWRKNMQRRAEGRVKLRVAEQRAAGAQCLLVSDENMLGSILGNVRDAEVYPAAGERMARYVRAFEGRVTTVVLTTRSLDRFWPSCLAHLIARGYSVPTSRKINDLVTARRGWRDVITDIACAMPGTEIRVVPFERQMANPAPLARACLGPALPPSLQFAATYWLNPSPSLPKLREILTDREQDPDQLPDARGAWQPFTFEQQMALQEAYADDLFWLMQGADGLATLTEDAMPGTDGRGHTNDKQGRLENTG